MSNTSCFSLRSFCNIVPIFVALLVTTLMLSAEPVQRCQDKCGSVEVPYPFYVSNCSLVPPPPPEAFHISCDSNKTSLFLDIHSQSYRVLHFFPDGLLLDLPTNSSSSFANIIGDDDADYFGISIDNTIELYDCNDSSICKADCSNVNNATCCFPLSDSSWNHNQSDFSMFARFGCRGFSSSVSSPDRKLTMRGLKLEWAFPANFSKLICGPNAKAITASSVSSGIRCQCQRGFAGDGFAFGVGCIKSCIKQGKEKYGQECNAKLHRTWKAEIIVGLAASTLTIGSVTALFCLLRRPIKEDRFDAAQIESRMRNYMSLQEACKTQLFNYNELEEATGGFQGDQLLCQGSKGRLYAGILANGSRIAVHKIQCDSEWELLQIVSRAEMLSSSAVAHKNLARPLGWSISQGYTLLVVYGYSFSSSSSANGTLKQRLRSSDHIEWCDRLNIAAETADVLAFLQFEISPPIYHGDLQSGYIFLDQDMSPKVLGFELMTLMESCSKQQANDVYNLGLILLEIITGADMQEEGWSAKLDLHKIRNGELEEIVDARLNYHEEMQTKREQIEIVADLATRCILFGGDGKIHIADVAAELTNNKRGRGRGRSASLLEETFSNSSLLQMISMSPDSIRLASTAPRGFS